jgi:hypothetical protein
MRLCDDEELTKHFALFLAELAVGHFLPPPAYYLRPMDFAWAMAILSRAAEECTIREIRRAKLYEASIFFKGSSIANGRRSNTGARAAPIGAMTMSWKNYARNYT